MRAPVRCLLSATLSVLVAVWAGPASAAPVFDHLQCFRIKDLLEKTTYTADLTAADPVFVAAERGCEIQMPARMLCVDARKTNVEPVPPGAPDGVPAQKYLCYRAKCGRTRPSTVLEDQFGVHLFSINSTTMICAPVSRAGASTTTTLPPCADADEDGWTVCDGDCDDNDPSVNPLQPETCDGIDNDCNGLIDGEDPDLNGQGQPCASGLPGICAEGRMLCGNGQWNCVSWITPDLEEEVCNGQDDNCDGVVDETDPNLGVPCLTGLPGQCASGHLVCVSPQLACEQDLAAGDEVCDGLDNDCDGAVDEGGCLPDGSHCNLDADCASQACVDGVCCNVPCEGTCLACSAAKKGFGLDGKCEPIAILLDPDGECPPGYTCDGAGSCLAAP